MARKATITDPLVHSQTRATWLASGVAVAALLISILSLYEARQARISTTKDDLSVRLHRQGGDTPISIVKRPSVVRAGTVVVPWSLLLSNVGSGTISVTGYEVTQIARSNETVSYSGLDSGLTAAETGEPVSLPLALEAGRSVRLNLNIGINPGQRAYEHLTESIVGSSATISLGKAELSLAGKAIDIYDNPVKPYIDNGMVVGFQIEDWKNEQVFLVKLTTSRGAVTGELAFWYDRPRQ
jgi:hypothetical protein